MENLVTGINKSKCTGCKVCSLICPKHCISMVLDKEGFYYPECDLSKCVHCGKCQTYCHIVKDTFHEAQTSGLGLVSQNDELLKLSTSGGIFSTLAQEFITQGAYVFGSIYDENFDVITVGTCDLNIVTQMFGSKYVFGNVSSSYHDAKRLLDMGKTVLYSGTPCQLAGLKCYLNTEYENLYLIDILCHGGPSAALFKEYLSWLAEKHHKKIASYVFRDKQFGRRTISTVTFEDGTYLSIDPAEDPYCAAFYSGKTYRPSCYECKYARRERVGDITIGDYWGAEQYHPKIDVSKGFSAVIVNDDKGHKLLDMIKNQTNMIYTTVDRIANNNSILDNPTSVYKFRNAIYEGIGIHRFDKVANKYMYAEPLWKTKFKSHIPEAFKKLLRDILKKA